MNKLEITKYAVNIIVGAGTSKIAVSVIKNNTQPQNVVDIVTMNAGALVLGQMAADASKTYTNAKIDEIADWWKKNVTKN